nr:hypothetical protein Iba_chr06bCG16260 [Ipomoea batatas]
MATTADLNTTGKCLGLTVLLIGSVWNGHNGKCVHILKPAIIIIRIMPVLSVHPKPAAGTQTTTAGTQTTTAGQHPPEPKPPPPPTDTGPQHRQIFGGWGEMEMDSRFGTTKHFFRKGKRLGTTKDCLSVFCVVGEFGRDPCLLVLLGMEFAADDGEGEDRRRL